MWMKINGWVAIDKIRPHPLFRSLTKTRKLAENLEIIYSKSNTPNANHRVLAKYAESQPNTFVIYSLIKIARRASQLNCLQANPLIDDISTNALQTIDETSYCDLFERSKWRSQTLVEIAVNKPIKRLMMSQKRPTRSELAKCLFAVWLFRQRHIPAQIWQHLPRSTAWPHSRLNRECYLHRIGIAFKSKQFEKKTWYSFNSIGLPSMTLMSFCIHLRWVWNKSNVFESHSNFWMAGSKWENRK